MSTIQEFETALNEIVQAKRLSQSKMLKLTDTTMNLMDQDTQLVSTLYRTHKSLPAACKISSLYVFDALARAARQHVVKHNISDRQATGNCATFLSKVAGVLEGLFQDMLATGLPEAKEKTKRIYDIWVKGGTFPPAILSRLLDIVSGKDKVSDVNTNAPAVSSDPRLPPPPTPTMDTTPNHVTPADPQSTLLALLTQAASQNIMQTTVNTPSPALDPAQLAVLQYLQLASTNNAAIPQIPPVGPTRALIPDTHVSQSVTDPRISTSRDESIFARHTERHDNYRSPPQNDRYHDRDHDARGHSGNDSRGNPRRRGRRNRWDDQGRDRDRYRERRERDQSPSSLKVPSRSRSPSNRNRRRDLPPRSPPRRNSQPFSTSLNGSGSPKKLSTTRGTTAEKDEFGRDLRPESPPSVTPMTPTSVITPTTNDVNNLLSSILSTSQEAKAVTSSTSTSNDPMSIPSSIAVNTSAKDHVSSDTSVQSESNESQIGLDSFDFTTFNPTLPASWEALGKMWQITNGYLPSMEELMQFVMMGTMSQAMSSGAWEQQDAGDSQWMNGKEEGGGGKVHPPGDDYYSKSRNGNGKQGWNNGFHSSNDQESEAIVLGGATGDDAEYGDINNAQQESSNDNRTGGKMQRVGDKWMFVRNDDNL